MTKPDFRTEKERRLCECGHTKNEHDCSYILCTGICHHGQYTNNECLCKKFESKLSGEKGMSSEELK